MVERSSTQSKHRWFRDFLRQKVEQMDQGSGGVLDPEQLEVYLDGMTASRHRTLVKGEADNDQEVLLTMAAQQAYSVVKWRTESFWAPMRMPAYRVTVLRQLGKMYLRPGSSLRKTVAYVRPWLDPEQQNVETSVRDIVHIAEEARLSAQHGNGQVIVIADLSGLDVNLRAGKIVVDVLRENFPGLLERACLVNVPAHADSFVHSMLAMLEPSTREKIVVLGSPLLGTALGRPLPPDIKQAIKEMLGEQDLECEFGGPDMNFQKKRTAFEEEFHRQSQGSIQKDCSWRPQGIYYRSNHLHVDIEEEIVAGHANSDGKLLSVHLVCVVTILCKISGMPQMKLYFSGAEGLKFAKCHHCAVECRAGAEEGEASIQFLPPDELFELLRFSVIRGPVSQLGGGQQPDAIGSEKEGSECASGTTGGERQTSSLWVEDHMESAWESAAFRAGAALRAPTTPRAPALPSVSEAEPAEAEQAENAAGAGVEGGSQGEEAAASSGSAGPEPGRLDLERAEAPASSAEPSTTAEGAEGAVLEPHASEERDGSEGGRKELATREALRAPVSIEATMIESPDGTESTTRVTLRLSEHTRRAEGLLIRAPLHPAWVPGTFQSECSAGGAYEEGGEMVWAVAGCGEQVGWTEREELTEGGREVTLEVRTLIEHKFVEVGQETGEEVPCARPAGSDDALWAVTQDVWQRRAKLLAAIAKLDEQKKPFYRDRSKLQRVQREQLEAAVRRMETVLGSSLLAGTLPPLRLAATRFHGALCSRLGLQGALLLNQHLPWAVRSTALVSCSQLLVRFLPHQDIPPPTPQIVLPGGSSPIAAGIRSSLATGVRIAAGIRSPLATGIRSPLATGNMPRFADAARDLQATTLGRANPTTAHGSEPAAEADSQDGPDQALGTPQA